jgi:alkanesulfonate monooxygenase SsuD/methylene tetrahydromethanopterin reductase-like flavin-dependent oxidoreductase (luciferase family)
MLDAIEIVRKVLRREVLVHDGRTVTIPLPSDQGTGVGKPLKLVQTPLHPAVPIWWAAMLDRSVQSAAEFADGWLPLMFVPEATHEVWGGLLYAPVQPNDHPPWRRSMSSRVVNSRSATACP